MTAVHGGSGVRYIARKLVFPVNYEEEVSQRLCDALHGDDSKLASECLADPFVDVNFVGTVNLKSKTTEISLHDEAASEVLVEYEEFKTEVTPLFLAAHAGNMFLVKKLLSLGANVNHKLFRGYATAATVREGHLEILEVLIDSGACQEACEEALLESSYLGYAKLVERLMATDMIRPQAALRALVSACCRGFVYFVDMLIKCGVDANATNRVLLRSSKPSLYANIDCNALSAAVVCRQTSVVRSLFQFGIKTDVKVKVGAWSWDIDTGEEIRVGAGLADAYPITWCAVEYFEVSGLILRSLLQRLSPNNLHCGRTLIHHAILCNNALAVEVLLDCGADVEIPVETTSKTELRPVHLAAKLGFADVLQCLIVSGCDIDSRTAFGDSALMICARYKRGDCLKVLASAGADFGLLNSAGQSASSIAGLTKWNHGFQQAVVDVILAGKKPRSSNPSVFSPLMFSIQANEIEALKKLLERTDIDLNEQDDDGNSAMMMAASGVHLEAFELLLRAGANIKLSNKYGDTAISLLEVNQNGDVFDQLMLEYALEEVHGPIGFYALHRAAKRGDLNLVQVLVNRGCDVNAFDADGYTPLMLSARGGHGVLCEFLISSGAKCDIENARHETALSLARKKGCGNDAENVVLNELARALVVDGSRVKKHTRCGKGSPHSKELKMMQSSGILRWGKSRRRNVVCKAAEVGPSDKFRWNRRRKLDVEEPGMFHVVTTRNKEVHFVCDGGVEMAQLWVRGIRLLTKEAIFGEHK
ncbi:kinase family protein [Hibiscus syriacus]|uniref:Kinase family protein n=1 Tax=Hibiscus syriacus TaxID=106335 RepID=A0A6A2Z944_HIBSY|nr:ankyrin-2-like [Hibiscus syriacus]KAE8687939.1 kinase family protein [Hibiscus syriacus]